MKAVTASIVVSHGFSRRQATLPVSRTSGTIASSPGPR